MIAASKAGLPVSIEKAPIPPQTQMSTDVLRPSLGPQKSLDAVIAGTLCHIYENARAGSSLIRYACD